MEYSGFQQMNNSTGFPAGFDLFNNQDGTFEYFYLSSEWSPNQTQIMFDAWLECLKLERCFGCDKVLNIEFEIIYCTSCERFHQMDLEDERGY